MALFMLHVFLDEKNKLCAHNICATKDAMPSLAQHNDAQPVLILGGGRGGLAFIQLLQGEYIFQIVGVVDSNPEAPAIQLAKTLNIPTFSSAEHALDTCRPCTAFNLTHDEEVSHLAARILGPSSIIGGFEAKLIWKMVTQLKDTRDELARSQILSQAVIHNAMDGIIVIDSQGNLQSFNPAAEEMFGYTLAEVMGRSVNMLMPTVEQQHAHTGYIEHYRSDQTSWMVGAAREVEAMGKNGQIFQMRISVNEMKQGNEMFFVAIISDITLQKKAEAEIEKLAHFDGITGLPNRVLFFDRLTNNHAQAKRQAQLLAVMFLDLDGFKRVNDTMGHHAGDDLLKQVATRLQLSIREVDTVARFGGDEFVFILSDIQNMENAGLVAQKVLNKLAEPYFIEGKKCRISGSIGIAMYPQHHTDMNILISQADAAMYATKNSEKNNFSFYDKSMKPK